MLTCDDVIRRLYDEDCRRALTRGDAPPADLASHVSACATCQRLWLEAADDAQGLRELLGEAPPIDLDRRLRQLVRDRLQPTSPGTALSGPLLDAAAGVTVLMAVRPELPESFASIGPLLWSAVGATVAFTAAALHDAFLRVR